MTPKIHPATTVGRVSLKVTDLDRLADYYQTVIGFTLRDQTAGQVTLGTAAEDILVLIESRGGRAMPNRPGLYHFAILLPSRPALGQWLTHLAESGYRLQGASDHAVSEALYLADPEGNGIEVYRDRPRTEWPLAGNEVRMTLDPLDFEGVVAEATPTAWAGLPAGTTLGHMHLQVNDTRQAEAFYVDVLGFDLMQRYPGASFISAGGYHHHLGANVWHSAGAAPRPPEALGLHSFSILLPDEAERQRLVTQIEAAGQPIEQTADGPLVRDPAGNGVVLGVV